MQSIAVTLLSIVVTLLSITALMPLPDALSDWSIITTLLGPYPLSTSDMCFGSSKYHNVQEGGVSFLGPNDTGISYQEFVGALRISKQLHNFL